MEYKSSKLCKILEKGHKVKVGNRFLVKLLGPYRNDKETVRLNRLDLVYLNLFGKKRNEKINELLKPVFLQDFGDMVVKKEIFIEAMDICQKCVGTEFSLSKLIESIIFVQKIKKPNP